MNLFESIRMSCTQLCALRYEFESIECVDCALFASAHSRGIACSVIRCESAPVYAHDLPCEHECMSASCAYERAAHSKIAIAHATVVRTQRLTHNLQFATITPHRLLARSRRSFLMSLTQSSGGDVPPNDRIDRRASEPMSIEETMSSRRSSGVESVSSAGGEVIGEQRKGTLSRQLSPIASQSEAERQQEKQAQQASVVQDEFPGQVRVSLRLVVQTPLTH